MCAPKFEKSEAFRFYMLQLRGKLSGYVLYSPNIENMGNICFYVHLEAGLVFVCPSMTMKIRMKIRMKIMIKRTTVFLVAFWHIKDFIFLLAFW